MKALVIALTLALVFLTASACAQRDERGTPTGPAPQSPPIGLTIAGRTSLAAIGGTTQLTATAVTADRTTSDVTRLAVWSSSDPSTTDVSPTGTVTALRYGVSYVRADYLGLSAQTRIDATPPGTYIVSGRVREPGNSGVPGALVTVPGHAPIVTGPGGEFGVGDLDGGVRIAFEKEGYEPAAVDVPVATPVDVPMQRIISLHAGESVRWDLAPHDMAYMTGAAGLCFPCRRVRIQISSAGNVELTASTNIAAVLGLWVNGELFKSGDAASPVTVTVPADAGELVVYVGITATLGSIYVPISLTSALR